MILSCLEESRSNCINSDAALCKVDCTPLCEACNTCLTCRISRNSGEWMICSHRGNVNDVGIVLTNHNFSENLCGKHSSVNVKIKLLVYIFEVHSEQCVCSLFFLVIMVLRNLSSLDGTAGTVYEDINVSPLIKHFLSCSKKAILVKNVGSYSHSLTAVSLNVSKYLSTVLLLTSKYRNLCTTCSKCACIHTTDNTGTSGNNSNFSRKINLKW